jgi:glucan phosphorylase
MMQSDKVVPIKSFAMLPPEANLSHTTIAYFSMEIGLHSAMKTSAGGLGILAGDMVKSATYGWCYLGIQQRLP